MCTPCARYVAREREKKGAAMTVVVVVVCEKSPRENAGEENNLPEKQKKPKSHKRDFSLRTDTKKHTHVRCAF